MTDVVQDANLEVNQTWLEALVPTTGWRTSVSRREALPFSGQQ